MIDIMNKDPVSLIVEIPDYKYDNLEERAVRNYVPLIHEYINNNYFDKIKIGHFVVKQKIDHNYAKVWDSSSINDFEVYSNDPNINYRIENFPYGFKVFANADEHVKWIAITGKIPESIVEQTEGKEVVLKVAMKTNIEDTAFIDVYDGEKDLLSRAAISDKLEALTLSSQIKPDKKMPLFSVSVYPKGKQYIEVELYNFQLYIKDTNSKINK